MRIGIDARILSLPATHRTGIARWNHNLLRGLAEIDRENEYILLCRMFESDRAENYGDNFSKIEIGEYAQLDAAGQTIEQLRISRTLNKLGIDLYYSPYYLIPLERNYPAVCLFDDLIPWIIMKKWSHLVPNSHSVGTDMRELQVWKRMSAMSADGIISISESTRKDLSTFWGIDSSKIKTVYSGVEPAFGKVTDTDAVRAFKEKAGLPDRYILYVGTLEPRKNIEGIIKAYALLRTKYNLHIPIVFAGQKGQSFHTIFTKTIERELGEKEFSRTRGHSFRDIHVITKFYSREEQVLLYNGASLLLWPSFYEGFGLPVLEGMACGLPVITSRTSSLPEVGGDAAVYVDPHDHGSIADKMAAILSDQQYREALGQKSLQQAAQFSLHSAAQTFLSFITSIADADTRKGDRAHVQVIEMHDSISGNQASEQPSASSEGATYEERLRIAMPSLYERIKPWQKPKKIIIQGAGFLGNYVLRHVNMEAFSVIGFIDSDPNKIGMHLGPYEVFSPEKGMASNPDVIWIASQEYSQEIVADLTSAGWPREKILVLWD